MDDRQIIIAGVVYRAEFSYFIREDFESIEHKDSMFIVPIETKCNHNSKTFKAIVIQPTTYGDYSREYVRGSIKEFPLRFLNYGYDEFEYSIVEDFNL